MAAKARPKPGKSFEESFGTRWVVWVGGVALALGGIFLVQLLDRAGPARAGRAACSSARCSPRRWSRPANGRGGRSSARASPALPTRAYPEHPDRGRHHRRLCDRLCRLRALRIPRPGGGLRPARRGRAGDARRRAAARPGARRARPGRRLRDAAAGRLGRAELLGALRSISRWSRRRPSRWPACGCGAGWRSPRSSFGVLWMLPGIDEPAPTRSCRARRSTPSSASRSPRCSSSPGCSTGRTPSRGKIDAVSSGALGGLSVGRACSGARAATTTRLALAVFALLIAATRRDRLADRGRGRRRCRLRRCSPSLVIAALGVGLRHRAPASRRRPGRRRAARPGIARPDRTSRARRRPSRRCSASPAILAQGRSERPLVPMLWAASAVVHAARDPDRALLSDRRLRALDPVRRRWRSLLAALFALRDRAARQARAPRPGGRGRRRDLRHRRGRGAGAGADLRAREGLAHASRFALMVPGIAWIADKRPLPVLRWLAAADRRAGGRAHRLGAAHRRRRRRHARRSSTGCSTATAFRRWRSGVAGHLLRRRADDMPARMVGCGGDPVHRAARRSSKSATS